MSKKVFMLCGIPGSGKSTFAKLQKGFVHVSRDEIRFEMVKEGEPYFSKEREVYKEYINSIKVGLQNPYANGVIADATHINRKSRKAIMKSIRKACGKDVEFYAIWFNTSLYQAMRNNLKRSGTRAYVPQHVIIDMRKRAEVPTKKEGFKDVMAYEFGEIYRGDVIYDLSN